jgi:hypothetical protein
MTRVSNVVRANGQVYSGAGGGWEMEFPYRIPAEFLQVLTLR